MFCRHVAACTWSLPISACAAASTRSSLSVNGNRESCNAAYMKNDKIRFLPKPVVAADVGISDEAIGDEQSGDDRLSRDAVRSHLRGRAYAGTDGV